MSIVLADTSFENLNEAPVVKFLNQLLFEAIKKRASDIHFEPYEFFYRIRFRIDGFLQEVDRPAHNLANRLSTRIKVMARLDIAEQRLPQDGSFRFTLQDHSTIDFRVSTCPTRYGEKIVLRLLQSDFSKIDIENLGFEFFQKKMFLDAIKKQDGMILVTGPTGSGKTITLYAALNCLNTTDRNIFTAEDPIELIIPGLNQVQIHSEIGLGFSNVLRSFLRQDPDIIMLGEIRDLETADIALKAAQTGHLVFSTLHTKGAVETLTRLLQMGIPSYSIADSVTLIIAQRLIRTLCLHCKKKTQKSNRYLAIGCARCVNGYSGRTAIFELLKITPLLSDFMTNQNSISKIKEICEQQGMVSLRKSAFLKVRQGLTTMQEINCFMKD